MPTEVRTVDLEGNYRQVLHYAADLLRAGKLVAFPTETVYGVGARADRAAAVQALRVVKGRQESKPFTLHVGSPGEVERYVPRLSGLARRFVRRAWPGPVTIVFPVDDPHAAPAVREYGDELVDLLYHDGTIGIRCPAEVVAAELLTEAAVPVVAASANRAGNPPPRTAEEVVAELDGSIDLLVDGGPARFAKASTVVRLGDEGYELMRHGVINERTLRRYGALNILFVCSGNTCRSPMAAALCRQKLAERLGCSPAELTDRNIHVTSAGTGGFGGTPASEGAVRALTRRGIDLGGHVAQALSADLIAQSDHIYCMTGNHREAVVSMLPSAAERTELLGITAEIEDPFGGPDENYERCAAEIDAALTRRIEEMLA